MKWWNSVPPLVNAYFTSSASQEVAKVYARQADKRAQRCSVREASAKAVAGLSRGATKRRPWRLVPSLVLLEEWIS